jgi:hypothetical protein
LGVAFAPVLDIFHQNSLKTHFSSCQQQTNTSLAKLSNTGKRERERERENCGADRLRRAGKQKAVAEEYKKLKEERHGPNAAAAHRPTYLHI